ncbi:MAG: hypothetical protein ACI9JT_000039 [Polaribacter sp.]|jgi:hypothetical protein
MSTTFWEVTGVGKKKISVLIKPKKSQTYV